MSAFNTNSLDLQCSVFHGRHFPISPLKSSKTNRELLHPGAWPATGCFTILFNEVTCNVLLANILDLWRNHYDNNSIVNIFHTLCKLDDYITITKTHINYSSNQKPAFEFVPLWLNLICTRPHKLFSFKRYGVKIKIIMYYFKNVYEILSISPMPA